MVERGFIMSAVIEKFAVWLGQYLDLCIHQWKVVMLKMVQYFLDVLVQFGLWVISLFPQGNALPTIPSTPVGQVFSLMVQCLNWVFPVSFLVSMAEWAVGAIILYLVIAPLARWAKLLT
jgi:hypothetical protein